MPIRMNYEPLNRDRVRLCYATITIAKASGSEHFVCWLKGMATMKQMLDLQADRIEQVLAEFGVTAQIFAGQVLPQVIVYQVQLGPGQRMRELSNLHTEIALALGARGVLVNHQDGTVTIEVPRPDRSVVTCRQIVAQMGRSPVPHTALLGLSNHGAPLMLYMPSPDVAHVLIAGMTGSGKTELLRTMLVSLAKWGGRRDMLFYLVDPKGRKLADLAGLESVMQCSAVGDALALVEGLLVEMERRDAKGYCKPRLYLLIDELADLVIVGGRVVEAAMTRILQRGREAGIHAIVATQRPSAAIMQGLMKANFPIRISGAVNCASDASIATGLPRSGAERLLGKGDMVLAHHGQLVRFQVCITEPQDLEGLAWDGHSKAVGTMAGVKERLQERLSLRQRGRPPIPPSQAMINFAVGIISAKGGCSQRALRKWHKKEFGADVNPPRARAAIEEAKKIVLNLS